MKKHYYKILFFIAVFIVLILATIPNDHIHLPFEHADKIKHMSAFFMLALLLNRASHSIVTRFRNMGALLSFGFFIELIQFFTPGRESSSLDILADLVGIILFQLLYTILKLIQENTKKVPITNI